MRAAVVQLKYVGTKRQPKRTGSFRTWKRQFPDAKLTVWHAKRIERITSNLLW